MRLIDKTMRRCGSNCVKIKILLSIFLFHSIHTFSSNLSENNIELFLKQAGQNCKWRPDKLVGTCFGLHRVTTDKINKLIHSAATCKEYCCNMGEKCITWQYKSNKGCFVGGNVRLGLEHANTPHWCEPTLPIPWQGQRILNRTKHNDQNKCIWGKHMPYQCFGLGPHKTGVTSPEDCAQHCCDHPKSDGRDCELWQFRQDKGCFTGISNNCDSDHLPWFGERKVIK